MTEAYGYYNCILKLYDVLWDHTFRNGQALWDAGYTAFWVRGNNNLWES